MRIHEHNCCICCTAESVVVTEPSSLGTAPEVPQTCVCWQSWIRDMSKISAMVCTANIGDEDFHVCIVYITKALLEKPFCPVYKYPVTVTCSQLVIDAIYFFPQIIFYEDRNFQGRHYECSSDSADLSPYFSRCNSIRVESDWWVLYERPNYMGYQYVLSRGEYPEYQRWMGFNDCIKSCRSYPPYRGSTYRMKIYERPDFGGQMMEFMDDCPSVYDHFRYRDVHSCQVMEGYWIFYEHPNYRGRQYFLRPGEYRRYSDWGGCNSMIGSFRRMRDF
ncbi:gamma-crystallin S-1-like [Mobula birostris]|uniref:gamma-crystallin S-1-like n=1 Tax=Mobula birostris TaxID=1983395 RepID=UPI003B289F56